MTQSAEKMAQRLRHHATTLRTNSLPLSDLIPLLLQAADALESKKAQPAEAGADERAAFEAWARSNWDLKGANPINLIGELYPAWQARAALAAAQPGTGFNCNAVPRCAEPCGDCTQAWPKPERSGS